MSDKKAIKLTPGAWDILKCLINGQALAVGKEKTEAYLVFGDYSFYKNVHHWHFDELKDKGMLKKIDSRVVSVFYSISDNGIKALKQIGIIEKTN